MSAAARAWAAALAGWSIPAEILDAAPRSPWGFDPAVFTASADEALRRDRDSPSDAAARAALPQGGTVLDVGAGAGTASLRLHETAGRVVAVDPSAALLAAFTERADRLGVAHAAVVGTWPQAMADVAVADVVTCHHVTYNVPDLDGFAAGLRARSRRRTVIEMTAVHPLTWMAPLWQELHGLERPEGPTADDAVAVLRELGWKLAVRRWERSYGPVGERDPGAFDRIARRLCLRPERHAELRRLLAQHPPPDRRAVVTIVSDSS